MLIRLRRHFRYGGLNKTEDRRSRKMGIEVEARNHAYLYGEAAMLWLLVSVLYLAGLPSAYLDARNSGTPLDWSFLILSVALVPALGLLGLSRLKLYLQLRRTIGALAKWGL